MPPVLALLICVVFIGWLLATERRKGSIALWIPIAWMAILGSRPVSVWLGMAKTMETTEDYLEGSPVDRLVFLLLIVAAVVLLLRRPVNWSMMFRKNKWLCVYFLYLGLSILWSDFPFTAFKRWVKDMGSVLMALLIVSENNPIEAIKGCLLRCAFILISFSVLFIKYFPDLGRAYDRWSHQPIFVGVTTNKNLLGMTLFVCGLALLWTLIDRWKETAGSQLKSSRVAIFSLLLMTWWLLMKAHSSTAVVCLFFGSAILLGMVTPPIRQIVNRNGIYVFGGACLLLLTLLTVFQFDEVFVNILGRDMTLTGRTEIWKVLLNEDINPWIGVGHYSFWLGDRVDRVSGDSWFRLNEAHNGYLETYLNTGLIGLFLLLMVLAVSARRIWRETIAGVEFAPFRLAVLWGVVVYSMTEAVFRLSFISFALLLTIIDFPCKPRLKSSASHSTTMRKKAFLMQRNGAKAEPGRPVEA